MLRTWRPILNSGMNLGVDLENVFCMFPESQTLDLLCQDCVS